MSVSWQRRAAAVDSRGVREATAPGGIGPMNRRPMIVLCQSQHVNRALGPKASFDMLLGRTGTIRTRAGSCRPRRTAWPASIDPGVGPQGDLRERCGPHGSRPVLACPEPTRSSSLRPPASRGGPMPRKKSDRAGPATRGRPYPPPFNPVRGAWARSLALRRIEHPKNPRHPILIKRRANGSPVCADSFKLFAHSMLSRSYSTSPPQHDDHGP